MMPLYLPDPQMGISRSSPLSVVVHAIQMQRPSAAAAVAVQLVGARRILPAIKRSQWATDRQGPPLQGTE